MHLQARPPSRLRLAARRAPSHPPRPLLSHRFFSLSDTLSRTSAALLAQARDGAKLTLAFRLPAPESTLRLLAFSERAALAKSTGGLLALGAYHSAAVLHPSAEPSAERTAASPSDLYTFGRGFHGQLGHGGFSDSAVPQRLSRFVAGMKLRTIHCGGSHCAALSADGKLYTWGLASSGELGHGGWTPIEVDVPRCVDAFVGKVVVAAVVTGTNHTLAIGACGGLWACGRGRCGQLGQGDFSDAGPMRRVERLRGERVVAASAGGSHSIALTASGEVWTWGEARSGQLGLGAEVMAIAAAGWDTGLPVPSLVVLPASNTLDPVVDVVAGGHHSLLRTASGRLLACGRGRHGALGLNDTRDYSSFTEVTPFCGGNGRSEPRCLCRLGGSVASRVVAARAGRDHSLVLTACGAVLTAGCNNYGTLGTGDTVSRASFTRVPGLPRCRGVSSGESHAGAVGMDGRLYLWGRGDWGQLGSSDYRSYWRATEVGGFRVPFAEKEEEAA